MEFEVPDRIHLAPMGYENERVVEPARDLRADKVIIVGHNSHGSKGKGYRSDVEEELEEQGIETDQVECNIFDFYDALGTIGEQVTKHEKDEVYVNVSTGSKVTAIAGMIGCMIAGATPYYARAHDYTGDTPSKIDGITKLPDYPIDPPSEEELKILEHLSSIEQESDSATKGDLIHFAERSGFEFITESNVQEKGKYRLLDSNIIEPLKDRGYVSISKSGRHKVVEITEDGQNAIRAFRYLIEPQQGNLSGSTASG